MKEEREREREKQKEIVLKKKFKVWNCTFGQRRAMEMILLYPQSWPTQTQVYGPAILFGPLIADKHGHGR